MYIDILNFKLVNDVFGSSFGDLALKKVADFLRSYFSKKAVFGRMGGDTFGVCLPKEEFSAQDLEGKLSHFNINDGQIDHNIIIHVGV